MLSELNLTIGRKYLEFANNSFSSIVNTFVVVDVSLSVMMILSRVWLSGISANIAQLAPVK